MSFYLTGYPFDSANHEEEVVWGGLGALARGRPPWPAYFTWRADEGVRRGPGGPPHKCAKQVLAESNGCPVLRFPGCDEMAGPQEMGGEDRNAQLPPYGRTYPATPDVLVGRVTSASPSAPLFHAPTRAG